MRVRLEPVPCCVAAAFTKPTKAILAYRPLYLCATHHAMWKVANEADRLREEKALTLRQRVRDIQPV